MAQVTFEKDLLLRSLLRVVPRPFKGESRLDVVDFWDVEMEKKFTMMNYVNED